MSAELATEHVPELLRAVVVVQVDDAIGTGFYITSSGLLATSAHLVEQRESVLLRRHDRSRVRAKVVRVSTRYDLALLWDESDRVPPPLPLADTPATSPGTSIVTIGHPDGLEFTLARGIVSANRVVDEVHYFQTDAPARPGTSGGPVLDPRGMVAGITTFGHRRDGVSFAVAVRYLQQMLGEVVLPAAKAGSQQCPSCGARNGAVRRSCRRCGCSLAPDATLPAALDIELASLLDGLDPPPALERLLFGSVVTMRWREVTFELELHDGLLHVRTHVGRAELATRVPWPARGPLLAELVESLVKARAALAALATPQP